MSGHRFPPPWRVVEHTESFLVEDATGRYVYFEDQPGHRQAMKRLTLDEARRSFEFGRIYGPIEGWPGV
jgi:hypothetical protein